MPSDIRPGTWDAQVLPHGPLRQLASNVWMITGSLPKGHLPRNMMVFRYQPGRLLVHSPVAVQESALREILAFGQIDTIIVPNAFHRLDGAVYKQRFPQATLICPQASKAKVAQKMPVDASCEEVLPKLGITFHTPPGIKPSELVYEFSSAGSCVLVMSDLLFNLPHLPGLDGSVFRLLGSSGFFGMTRIGKWLLLNDRRVFQQFLRQLAKTAGLKAVCVAHGEPVQTEVDQALLAAANRLG